MVETFTQEEFLLGLPVGSYYYGIRQGEHCYIVPIDNLVGILVRSSIHEDGISASTGKDSIRMLLWELSENLFLGKLDTYTTRIKGWQSRIEDKITYLKEMRNRSGDCPDCGKPKACFVTQNGSNSGRPYCKCMNCGTNFTWLDKPTSPYFTANEAQSNSLSDLLKETEDGEELNDNSSIIDFLNDTTDNTQISVEPDREPNKEQIQAICAPFVPVRVEAGPGSGKTFTIARRYEQYIRAGIAADNIFAVTFNAKMAQELGQKIQARCPEIIGTLAEKQICTIHAFCLRMLKAYYPRYNVFKVPPDWQVKKFITEFLDVNFSADKRPSYEETRDVIFAAKQNGYNSDIASIFYANLIGGYCEKITQLHEEFDRWLDACKFITYPDMLLKVETNLNEDKNFFAYVRSRVKAIIIDEAQDTNNQAMRILTHAVSSTNNIFIVGDRDQLLYRFTGATPEANLGEGFEERFPNGISYPLVTNYRSTKEIVRVSRKSITNNYYPIGPYDDRYLKALTHRPDAEDGKDFHISYYPSQLVEALSVAENIERMIDDGIEPDEFFIGFRTRAQAGYLEFSFAKRHIPFVNTTGMSFWTMKHIQDVLAYLKLSANRFDAESFKTILNIPSKDFTVPWKNHPDYGKYINHRFLSNVFLDLCSNSVANIARVCSIHFKYASGGNDILNFLQDISAEFYASGVGDAIRFINEHYAKYVNYESGNAENSVGEGSKLEDLATVAEIGDQFTSIEDFLAYVQEMVKASISQDTGDWHGKVVFSTIHRLKGLERNYVFGIGISEYNEAIPNSKPTGILPHTFSMVKPPNLGVFDVYGKGRIEDERCLFYVLITRAKKAVYLSSIGIYRQVIMKPSRFLNEISHQFSE